MNTSPEQEFSLRKRAKEAAEPLFTFLQEHTNRADWDHEAPYVKSMTQLKIARGFKAGHVESAMIGDIIATVPLFSRAAVWILDRLLSDPTDILSQVKKGGPQAREAVSQYVRNMYDVVNNDGYHHGLMNERFFVAVCIPVRVVSSVGLPIMLPSGPSRYSPHHPVCPQYSSGTRKIRGAEKASLREADIFRSSYLHCLAHPVLVITAIPWPVSGFYTSTHREAYLHGRPLWSFK